MGIIISEVTVRNVSEKDSRITFDAIVDTGSTFLTLPKTWKSKLGNVEILEEVELEMASGEIVDGELCSPVLIKIGDFREFGGDVLFIDMEADAKGDYEPLIGYLPLESIPVGVDMLNHRLVKVKALLK
ncbi:MAG: aspartyl protease family protein [Aridibacter sp.]